MHIQAYQLKWALRLREIISFICLSCYWLYGRSKACLNSLLVSLKMSILCTALEHWRIALSWCSFPPLIPDGWVEIEGCSSLNPLFMSLIFSSLPQNQRIQNVSVLLGPLVIFTKTSDQYYGLMVYLGEYFFPLYQKKINALFMLVVQSRLRYFLCFQKITLAVWVKFRVLISSLPSILSDSITTNTVFFFATSSTSPCGNLEIFQSAGYSSNLSLSASLKTISNPLGCPFIRMNIVSKSLMVLVLEISSQREGYSQLSSTTVILLNHLQCSSSETMEKYR